MSTSLQNSNIEQNDGNELERHVASLGAQYRNNNLRLGSKLEYRVDENISIGSEQQITQWLTANSLEYKASDAWRWLGKLNHSITESDLSGTDQARFTELDLGFAFRPTKHDRLNLLGRYSFLYDLGSEAQFNGSLGNPTLLGPQPDERAHIVSVEALYDITRRWEVGGKLAARRGSTRLNRDSGPWFDQGINLAIVKGRYHFIKHMDAVLEYRWLEDSELKDVKSGALTGLYFHLGKHVKLGGGYNFTDFSDNLKDTSYDHQGWFIDVVGKF